MNADIKQILLIDDERELLDSMAERLELMGFLPLTAESGQDGLEIARAYPVDMAIVDLKMPGMDGLVTITKLKEIHPGLRTVLLTGYGDEKVRQATEALNSDYFKKDEMAAFWGFIKKLNTNGKVVVISPPGASGDSGLSGEKEPAAESGANRKPDSSRATPGIRNNSSFFERPRIIGETPAMQELRKNLERVANLDCTVIIRGETGTGKELAARVIHATSRRRGHRFLAINCGCFGNEQLIEQLLGPQSSGFAEAFQTQSGILGVEPGGTILLDQIEDMPLQMQVQLLKIIDTTESLRATPGLETVADVRILAASETNLRQGIREGTFRKDLYYRLNLFELSIPPLRQRKDDIAPLCSYFLDKYRKEFQKPVESIEDEVISVFMAYDFPGNVRELEHVIERAVILADGRSIKVKHLPGRFQREAAPAPNTERFATLAEMEMAYILKVLEATNHNKVKTAEILGISRAALWRKLKQFKESKAS